MYMACDGLLPELLENGVHKYINGEEKVNLDRYKSIRHHDIPTAMLIKDSNSV